MKTEKTVLLIAAAALVILYFGSKARSIGALPRGYMIEPLPERKSGCHKGEINQTIRRIV